MASKADAAYEEHKRRKAEGFRETSATGRDIGRIPDIADTARREECRASLRRFCEIYNPETFALAWSMDQLRAIERIEEAATLGALYAFAMPRGSGKTAIVRMGALWAVSYAICRYVYLIGATADKGMQSLEAIKTWARFLPTYAADFPEIAYPAQRLKGIAQGAHGQLCLGESTLIQWSTTSVVLPTVPPPANWPKSSWPLRSDGMVPTSGAIIGVSGLTGEGIRGSLATTNTGESLRPDLVLLDDPQTDESAASLTQTASRERLISGAVLGMAGPGKSLSAVMPCTVIRKGDMADRVLDRSKHPLWRGERSKMLITMPTDLAAWDAYFHVYLEGMQAEPPTTEAANAYYLAHQAQLEAGTVAAWPARKKPDEVSAIQHAMHLYVRDKAAFFAEYQNEPQDDDGAIVADITAALLASRINNHARGTAPKGSTRLTAFIDVQESVLFYALVAWGEDFTGAVVDYGTWPKQQRSYFGLRDLTRTLAQEYPEHGLEARITAGLQSLTAAIVKQDVPIDGGGSLRVELCLIDSGHLPEVVERAIRSSPHRQLLGWSKGYGISAAAAPMSEWAKKDGERRGLNWVRRGGAGLVLYDANSWKSFVLARLSSPIGGSGALTVYGTNANVHRLLFDHCTAERKEPTTGRGRVVEVWRALPNRDNHWWDCIVGCAVAASVQGCVLPSSAATTEPKKKRERVSFEELRRRARA